MKPSESAETQLSSLEDSPSHLLHRVLQIALEIYTSEMGDNALTQRQYVVLSALDGSEGLSQADLVRITGIDRSTLADMVARMLSKGLLMRERSATDARANLVRVSEQGQAALADMRPRVLSADEKILALLSPPKRDSFLKLLRRIINARDIGPTTDEAPPSDKPRKAKAEKKKKKEGKGKKAKSSAKAAAKKLRNLHSEAPLPYPDSSAAPADTAS